jgi:putative two-component system response regulator
MKQHPVIGDSICCDFRLLKDVIPIIRHHHERTDGSGYPDRLSGEDIPLLARVMSIVDTYDAVTSARPYKPAFTSEKACRELRNDVQRGWKSAFLVEEFVSIVSGLTPPPPDTSIVDGMGSVEPSRTSPDEPSAAPAGLVADGKP